MASQLRDEITAALKRELERIEGQSGAWRGGDAERREVIVDMLANLEANGACFMEIRRELKPWEIRL